MPVPNPTRRTGPRRSALALAGLAAALTLGVAAGLGGPTAPAASAAGTTAPASQPQTQVTTVYQVTPAAQPAPVVVVHHVVAGGDDSENDGND